MPMKFLLYPMATEKAINMVERENIITYVVDMRATKKDIRGEFQKMFNVKVARVTTEKAPKNIKKAFIRLDKSFKASDIALKLKLV